MHLEVCATVWSLREVITIDIVDKSRQITATEVRRKIYQKRLSKQMGKMFS